MHQLDYRVIQSGSSGNAVRIADIMIDCGIPYTRMRDELYKCKLLFITHKHSDHLNIRTYSAIKKNYRHIKTIANYDVATKITPDFILGDSPRKIKTKNYVITPFKVNHDVVTHGLTIAFRDGINVIYVTDSAGTDEWPKGKYDYLFLESNHDENILNLASGQHYGYDVFAISKRHTSKQEAKAFYYLNRKSKDSEFIELHKSQRFYR